MNAVMEAGTRPAVPKSVAMPHEVREVMERHLERLEGLPTPEFVAAICREPEVSSHQSLILKFFLLESPLRARDLGTLLCGIGQNRAKQLCTEVVQLRARRLARGNKPHWEEASTS